MIALRDAVKAEGRGHPRGRVVAIWIAMVAFLVLGIGKAAVLCHGAGCEPHVALAHEEGGCDHADAGVEPVCHGTPSADELPHREALATHHECMDLALLGGFTRAERSRVTDELRGVELRWSFGFWLRPSSATARAPWDGPAHAPPRADAGSALARTTVLRI